MNDNIEHQQSSSNIYADLGLEEAEELQARGLIGYHVYKLLADTGLKQREIGVLLGIKQPEVSHLMNGHFSRFTTDKLLEFLRRLDHTVTIHISPHRQGEPFQRVSYVGSAAVS